MSDQIKLNIHIDLILKVRRVDERLKKEKGEKDKIQPTLRSFMDLRSGFWVLVVN